MKHYKSRYILIFSLIALLSFLDIFDWEIILLLGLGDSPYWEILIDAGCSMIEIMLVCWAFFIGKKIILNLKEKEYHYRRIVELSPEAIFVHQEERIVYTNQAGARLLGVEKPADLLNIKWKEFIQPNSVERPTVNGQEGGVHYCLKVKRLDGVMIDIETTSTKIEFAGEPAREVIAKDITNRRKQEAIVSQLAYSDPLTGLPNRRAFLEKLTQLIEQSRNTHLTFAVFFIDLDGFKNVNDTYGHESGDELLKEVSERFKGSVRERDLVARLGGDEFTILLPNATRDDCMLVAKRILKRFDQPIFILGKKVQVTSSVGIALYPYHGTDAQELMNQADLAMYHAKHKGKNRFHFVTFE